MHGKSGCFALQKSRFRNAKTKLPFFFRIIFTRLRVFFRVSIRISMDSRKPRNPMRTSLYLAAKSATPHALHIAPPTLYIKRRRAPRIERALFADV
ncbi:hypothetical protein CLI71_11070 [Prevotella intermedia]|uniref:Uncharacterized protein n=1 Tax=Prevotella intermedia TaxID=28131 RepID=A0A2A6ED20_PREIN|nr:hypothetical protein CLI71_11070 [Prevotella intermedia]